MENGDEPETSTEKRAAEATGEVPEIGTRSNKESSKLKDLWTVTFSTLAVVISALGFYVNSLERVDDLSAVVGELPTLRFDANKKPWVAGESQITFINAGNQPSAFMLAQVHVKQLSADLKEEKCPIEDITETDLKPFVLKAAEIVVKDFRPKDHPAPLPDMLKPGFEFENVEICFRLWFVTPSESRGYKELRYVVEGKGESSTVETPAKQPSYFARAISLRHERESGLTSWWNAKFNATNTQ